MLQQLVEVVEEPENSTLFIDNFLCRKYFTLFMEQPVEVPNGSNDLICVLIGNMQIRTKGTTD